MHKNNVPKFIYDHLFVFSLSLSPRGTQTLINQLCNPGTISSSTFLCQRHTTSGFLDSLSSQRLLIAFSFIASDMFAEFANPVSSLLLSIVLFDTRGFSNL
jgi:hypothetical protein